MAFNIEDWKANGLNLNGARPSLFEVIITDWPGSNSDSEQRFRMFAKASQIPPSILGQVEAYYFGRAVKFSGDRQYANWPVSIYNDQDWNVRATLEAWHQSINQHVENTMAGVTPDPSSYKRAAIVRQYSQDKSIIATYTVKGIFPVQIDAIMLDWEAGNQIEMFDVEFSIDYWLPYEDIGRSETANLPDGARNILSSLTQGRVT